MTQVFLYDYRVTIESFIFIALLDDIEFDII